MVVPNLTVYQKTVITNVLRRVLRNSSLKAYERHALQHAVRVVRSNPHTVRSLFQAQAMTQSRLTTKPQCRCTDSNKQTNLVACGVLMGMWHCCPCNWGWGGRASLRPNDPVPLPGVHARAKAVSGITNFCNHLQVPLPPLDVLLPKFLFPKSSSLFRQLQRLSTFLSRFQYVRIVHKGAGEMWGFCASWV